MIVDAIVRIKMAMIMNKVAEMVIMVIVMMMTVLMPNGIIIMMIV
jgi:hypothetical protein